MKLRTGDTVKVMTGKDKGKTGKIIQVFPRVSKVVVEGVAVFSKHIKTRKQGDKGQKVSFSAPIAIANVMLLCPKCGKTTRVGQKISSEGNRLRICKRCKETL